MACRSFLSQCLQSGLANSGDLTYKDDIDCTNLVPEWQYAFMDPLGAVSVRLARLKAWGYRVSASATSKL